MLRGCVLSHFSRVWLFATTSTVARQAPLSMGFSKQEYWSGLSCPLQGTILTQGSNACLSGLLYWQVVSLPLAPPGKPCCVVVVQSLSHVWLFVTPECSIPGLPVLHRLPELAQTHAIELVMPSNDLVLCHPLLLLPSVFPSIRVFSNELVLYIRWPKYWSISFSINPSSVDSGLISFRIAPFLKDMSLS